MADWTDYPPLMRAKMREHHGLSFEGAMRANRRPTDLMMLPVDWNPDAVPARAIVELKHDGIHLGYSRRVDVGGYSREGTPFRAIAHLRGALDAVEGELQRVTGQLHRLYGEYVHPDGFDTAVSDFQRGRGTGVVMLFDAVTEDAWRGREHSLPLDERRARLNAAAAAAGVSLSDGGVSVIRHELFVGAARDRIEVAAGEVWRDGGEGLVIKDAGSPYVRGPSPYWMRLKRTETLDLPIVDVDVHAGRVKAVLVEAKRGVVARIGRGLSDALRAAPALFRRGRIVEVRHLGRTASGNLRSSSFVRFRPDKES